MQVYITGINFYQLYSYVIQLGWDEGKIHE